MFFYNAATFRVPPPAHWRLWPVRNLAISLLRQVILGYWWNLRVQRSWSVHACDSSQRGSVAKGEAVLIRRALGTCNRCIALTSARHRPPSLVSCNSASVQPSRANGEREGTDSSAHCRWIRGGPPNLRRLYILAIWVPYLFPPLLLPIDTSSHHVY